MAQIDVRGMRVAIYLRKSRADLDDESKGHGDTLARHRETLLALADRLHVAVGKIYPEVVSGETIASRPQMQALLHDLEAGLWERGAGHGSAPTDARKPDRPRHYRQCLQIHAHPYYHTGKNLRPERLRR